MSSLRLNRRSFLSSTSSEDSDDLGLSEFISDLKKRTTLGMRISVTTSQRYAQITTSCVGTLAIYDGKELSIRSPFRCTNPSDYFSSIINGEQLFQYQVTSRSSVTFNAATDDTWNMIYVPLCSAQVNKNLPERMLKSQVELIPLTPMAWGSPVQYTPFDPSSYGYLHEDDDVNLVIIIVDLNYRCKITGIVPRLADLCRKHIFDARIAGPVTFSAVETANMVFNNSHATSTNCSDTSFASVRYVGANSVSLGTLSFSDDYFMSPGTYSMSSATFNAISRSAIRLTRIARFTSS